VSVRSPMRNRAPTRKEPQDSLALIEAARGLLKSGVGALTVKAVTERADVRSRHFYHHFPSTEAVLAAGIVESMRSSRRRLERGFADAADKSWCWSRAVEHLRDVAAPPRAGLL